MIGDKEHESGHIQVNSGTLKINLYKFPGRKKQVIYIKKNDSSGEK